MAYNDPIYAAEQMFKFIMDYLEKHLRAQKERGMNWRENELAQYDAFSATKRNVYVGGEKYLHHIDEHITSGNIFFYYSIDVLRGKNKICYVSKTEPNGNPSWCLSQCDMNTYTQFYIYKLIFIGLSVGQCEHTIAFKWSSIDGNVYLLQHVHDIVYPNPFKTGNNQPLLVVGDAGYGKSALLSIWIHKHKEKSPDDALVYVFAGATEGSASTYFLSPGNEVDRRCLSFRGWGVVGPHSRPQSCRPLLPYSDPSSPWTSSILLNLDFTVQPPPPPAICSNFVLMDLTIQEPFPSPHLRNSSLCRLCVCPQVAGLLSAEIPSC